MKIDYDRESKTIMLIPESALEVDWAVTKNNRKFQCSYKLMASVPGGAILTFTEINEDEPFND